MELNRLTQSITARLPRIEITDLLVEVDSWTSDQFSQSGSDGDCWYAWNRILQWWNLQ